MNPIARSRLAAYALDIAGYAAIAVGTVPFGLTVRRLGWGKSQSAVLWLSTTPVLIATAVAAVAESRGATWGKRAQGLRVERVDGGDLSLGQALVRNVVKVAVPWQLGHVTAVRGAFGGFEHPDAGLIGTTVGTYAMTGAGIAGVLSRSGITLHDRLSGSRVVRTEQAAPTTHP